jgi:flagellar assembly protein FliH
MLAKVLKQDSTAGLTPFAFPEIGGTGPATGTVDQFVIPEINGLPRLEPAANFNAGEQFESEPDQTAQVENILRDARQEAARIIAQAEENAAHLAQAAQEKAVQEIQAQFDAEVLARTNDIRLELAQTIEQVACLAEEISNRHEKQLVELALQIAKKVVAREVTIDREIAFTLVKVSLGKLHSRAVAEVHLNPEDFAYVESHREKLNFRGSLELVEDKSISIGGCLIHTETGDIDARIESQFEEIAHGLME